MVERNKSIKGFDSFSFGNGILLNASAQNVRFETFNFFLWNNKCRKQAVVCPRFFDFRLGHNHQPKGVVSPDPKTDAISFNPRHRLGPTFELRPRLVRAVAPAANCYAFGFAFLSRVVK